MTNIKSFTQILTGILVLGISSNSFSQNTSKDGQDFDIQLNTITTAVPFLSIAPDSRASGMGDIGVATSPDINSLHWNAAKYAFAEEKMGVSFSYAPWLRNLGINDINLAYLVGYKKIDNRQAIAGGLRYFSLGSITFTDDVGTVIKEANPKEFSFDLAYSVKLSRNLSGGISSRFIYSNLTDGISAGSVETKPGTTFAVDLSTFYKSNKFKISGNNATINVGVNVSNIGPKIKYTNSDNEDFLPANLRLGSMLNLDMNEYNQFSIGVDFNKLLVPSPAAYSIKNPNEIVSGRDNNVSVASGIFGSFTDAPGNVIFDNDNEFVEVESGSVLIEELREVNVSLGMEYVYAQKFKIRAGYFHEHYTKGNRRYITMGVGLKYSKMDIDFSYLASISTQNPLANTIRLSLGFNFNNED